MREDSDGNPRMHLRSAFLFKADGSFGGGAIFSLFYCFCIEKGETMRESKNFQQIKRMTAVAMLCALAFVLTYLKIPVMFLSLEVKDSVIVLCTLLFGPVSGLVIAVLVPLLELITHSTTGVYGLIMNMLSSVTFALVAGVIYKYKRSFYGAIAALVSGVLSVTAVMVLANLFVTPYYMGVSTDAVIDLIPKVLLPFNLVKAMLNAAIVLLLYKPLSSVLKRTGFLVGNVAKNEEKNVFLRSIGVTIIAFLVIFASLVTIFLAF